ncbi:MAG: CoA ester lyase [Aquamicrobium sp.]|uniref:HpcH/HpaI aldolase/citrate lyase family protein n=1 Tax=Aquamicrobium sp. TaxID=1872579 RepID=UPI00349EBAFB|nr:CoA ester lyase [Aquamicrobium sp.]
MRSKLFVPGSRPELFSKALASDADAVSFDLEDSVVEERKETARASVARLLAQQPGDGGKALVVRLNGLDSPHFAADLHALAPLPNIILNLPKIDSAEQLKAALARAPRREDGQPHRVLANIESPAGLRNAAAIAAVDGVMGLQIGFGDLFITLGARHTPELVRHVRIAVRLAAAEASIPCFDGAFVNVADDAGFVAEAEAARALGFSGKSCIHPRQIAAANRAFLPTDEELAAARAIVEAAEARAGIGAFMLDGRMIDFPFIEQARRQLRMATAYAHSEGM